MSPTPAEVYKQAAIENAPPVVVVRMLLEGALDALARAAASDPHARGSAFPENLRRADAIVVELRLALDHRAQPEIAGQIAPLYLFVEARIRAALADRDVAPIEDARAVLAKLHDAWSHIDLSGGALAA